LYGAVHFFGMTAAWNYDTGLKSYYGLVKMALEMAGRD
jgi:hypothetical protein